MKKILIIGIGAGDPDYVTMQAVKAMNEVDVFFIMDKGEDKSKLTDIRKDICQRYITNKDYRFVEAHSPEWNRRNSDYHKTIGTLNNDKQAVFESLIANDLKDGEIGAFLIWGEPSLYDSTVRIMETIVSSDRYDLDFEVIPGISSIQALAAKHKTTLNTIGKAVQVTTGRKLLQGFPETADSVVVMLDANDAYRQFIDENIDIYWGAYIGTSDEILVSGKLHEVADDIQRIRTKARDANGWIMDTYILRKNDDPTG
ncbi:MAG: precorrin-6A synthase (deacetylating) [Methylocystaceae bacterium]|nr:precorrin-6A synthase (deacetylating) [Methylocystaceae bacterium]